MTVDLGLSTVWPPGSVSCRAAQTADKYFSGGLEGPQVRNLNLRGERWPRPPLVSVDSSGSLCHLRWQVSRLLNHSHFPDGRAHGFAAPLRVALPPSVATAHRAGASLRATGHTLPSVPLQSGFVSPGFAGRAGSLRPWAQTFLKHLAEKAAVGGLFRQTEPPQSGGSDRRQRGYFREETTP